MKVLICTLLLVLFVNGCFACSVSIYKIKAKTIYGKVIDEYQNTIPNAAVQIYKNREGVEEILAETKADENGIFEIAGFKTGRYMIRANAENFTYSYAALKLNNSSNKVKNEGIIFALVPYGKCSGTVEMKKI